MESRLSRFTIHDLRFAVFGVIAASAEDLDLQSRAEDYPAEVPEGVRGLTMAVDCQNDRLEAAVYGWDKQSRSHGLSGIASFTETPVVDRYGKN